MRYSQIIEGADKPMLEREFEYYRKNMKGIREKYLGKEIVIVGEEIIAAYDDFEEAFFQTSKTYTPGNFMIHKVPVDIKDEVITLSPFGI
jgi:hypothetical protein